MTTSPYITILPVTTDARKINLNWLINIKVILKTLLQQEISEPEFYGYLVYKFNRKIPGKSNVFEEFQKLLHIIRGWDVIDIMWQTACLVFNPVMVDSYAFLFNCMMVDQVSGSVMM